MYFYIYSKNDVYIWFLSLILNLINPSLKMINKSIQNFQIQ